MERSDKLGDQLSNEAHGLALLGLNTTIRRDHLLERCQKHSGVLAWDLVGIEVGGRAVQPRLSPNDVWLRECEAHSEVENNGPLLLLDLQVGPGGNTGSVHQGAAVGHR